MNVSNIEALFLVWSQCKVSVGLSPPSVVGKRQVKLVRFVGV